MDDFDSILRDGICYSRVRNMGSREAGEGGQMSKFKVGDRVRYRDSYGSGTGTVGHVVHGHHPYPYTVKHDPDCTEPAYACFNDSELEELSPEPTPLAVDDYFAKKHDAGKPDFSLLPADVIALVYEVAAEEYSSPRPIDNDIAQDCRVIAALNRGVANRSAYDLALSIVLLSDTTGGGLDGLMRGIVAVLEFGAKKYSRDSWQTVPDAERRYYSAAMRHALADDHADPESGLDHAFHLGCNLVFICHLIGKSQAVTA